MDSWLIIELIAEKLQSLPDCHNLQDFIPEFYHFQDNKLTILINYGD